MRSGAAGRRALEAERAPAATAVPMNVGFEACGPLLDTVCSREVKSGRNLTQPPGCEPLKQFVLSGRSFSMILYQVRSS